MQNDGLLGKEFGSVLSSHLRGDYRHSSTLRVYSCDLFSHVTLQETVDTAPGDSEFCNLKEKISFLRLNVPELKANSLPKM